jgi:hypothetical protein
MKSIFIFAISATLLACASGVASAGEKPEAACSDPVMHQFDFWIGHWQVTENGKPAGTNNIERILDGCALLENWVGAQGSAGKSLNFYDRADGLWHQTWVDRNGDALILAGKYSDGAMRLEGERPATKQQAAMRHRITWTALPGGNVRQLWESSPPGKDAWSVQFDGLYVPTR